MNKTYLNKHLEELTNRVIILEKMVAHLLYTEPQHKDHPIKIPYSRPKHLSEPKEITETDELFDDAWKEISKTGKVSTSYLQRRLAIGYNRAAIIMDQLENKGIISEADGVQPRNVLKPYAK